MRCLPATLPYNHPNTETFIPPLEEIQSALEHVASGPTEGPVFLSRDEKDLTFRAQELEFFLLTTTAIEKSQIIFQLATSSIMLPINQSKQSILLNVLGSNTVQETLFEYR